MSSSERMLLIITVVVAVIAVPFYFWDSISGALGGGSVGSLAAQRDTFHAYVKVVEKKAEINSQYEEITRNNAPGGEGDMDPGGVFMNDLDRMLRQDFNQPNPRIGSFQRSPIPKVEDYYFIDVDVSMDGEIRDLIRLLIKMENSGLLIKEFTLEQRGSVRGGADRGTLNVTVSRLAQHNAKTKALMARLRR